MYVHGIRALFPFPGYVVEKVTLTAEIAQVILRRDGRFRLACRACGARRAANRTKTETASGTTCSAARGTVRASRQET